MNLQEKILNDLKSSSKETKDSLKVIIGEMQRQPTKILSDDQVIAILKKLVKYEEERISKTNEKLSIYLEILQSYLPKQISKEEVETWINSNIDFSSLKNKNQAIGIVCKHFGSAVDGSIVKSIINSR